ncbi:NAD(P)H-hydrate dehydratase [bacterium]|nr:NAD(P)H-hydrate dehydratase [bacterium]
MSLELLSAGQMRAADRAAIDGMNIPSLKLMEAAGAAVAQEALKMIRKKRGRIAVFCGKGNNGGDGLVAARRLSRRGHAVTVILTVNTFSPDAAAQWKRLPKRVAILRAGSADGRREAMVVAGKSDLVIDALFGTGLSQPLKSSIRKLVEDINRLGRPVLAVDIPSGIDASTGQILGTAVRARATVTFARPKIGHILQPGAEYGGRLDVVDIGIPDEAVRSAGPDTFLMERSDAARILPARPDHSHKGTYGRSVILAGSRGMLGAAVLAAEAALRIGSGLTTLCVPAAIYSIVARKLSPEIMCQPVPDGGTGMFRPGSIRRITQFTDRAACILIGPGIGRHPETIRWVEGVLRCLSPKSRRVLDADALFALAARKFRVGGDATLTPHAGEMSRLIGASRAQVEADMPDAARTCARKYDLTVVLKGSRSLIAEPGGRIYINRTGNAALAKGATGDVLAGLICGLAAQGLSAFDASRLGVYLHGRAADIAVAQGRDKRTFLASDIFTYLDDALREISIS